MYSGILFIAKFNHIRMNMLDCTGNKNHNDTIHDGEEWTHQHVTIHSNNSNRSLESNKTNRKIKMSTTLYPKKWKKITNTQTSKFVLGVMRKDKLWYISRGIHRLTLTPDSFDALLFETVLDKLSDQTMLCSSGSSTKSASQQMYVQIKENDLVLVKSTANASGFDLRVEWRKHNQHLIWLWETIYFNDWICRFNA